MLADAIQAARHTAQLITWDDADGDPQDLTGATLSGRIVSRATGEARDIDGDLEVVTALLGTFRWIYGEDDVADAGNFRVQFIAEYAGPTNDKSLYEPWTVHPAL